MARPQKCRCICSIPKTLTFFPEGDESNGIVTIGLDEYEVIRLLDYEKKSQEMCAQRMNISRSTVTRMYDSVRNKLATAFVEGKQIRIDGGDVMVCTQMRPECVDEEHCCHKDKLKGETK